jgi:serpin B
MTHPNLGRRKMKFLKLSLYTLLLAGICVGCACNRHTEDPPEAGKQPPASFGVRSNAFAMDLYAKADAPGKNLFYSPYSISTALAMAYAGAKGNTAVEMANALHFDIQDDQLHESFNLIGKQLNAIGERNKAELSVANALFGAKRHEKLLVPGYLEILRSKYASDLYSLDFGDAEGTARYINSWVEDKTNDRIKDLVTKDHILQSNDGMVLVNAIYFKGLWQKQFDPKSTHKASFYLSQDRVPENAKPVNMMYQTGEFLFAELPGYQMLELPYEEQDLAMLLILPDDIDGFAKAFNQQALANWQKALDKQKVDVFLPAFKFELTLEGLTDYLKALGIKDAFSDSQADFTGIRDPKGGADLYIMDVIHKAFVEVKEEGTEAAAATAVVMATKSVSLSPTFRADHPFVYMILHKPSNTILFLGKYAVPPEEKQ